MYNTTTSSVLRVLTIVLLLLVSLSAIAAGYSFITDPSGSGIGISTTYLKASAPFENYFVPGIILLAVNGLLSMVVAYAVIRRLKHHLMLVMLQGAIYVGWIVVQLSMVTTFHVLHGIIGFIGITLIAVGFMMESQEKLSQDIS